MLRLENVAVVDWQDVVCAVRHYQSLWTWVTLKVVWTHFGYFKDLKIEYLEKSHKLLHSCLLCDAERDLFAIAEFNCLLLLTSLCQRLYKNILKLLFERLGQSRQLSEGSSYDRVPPCDEYKLINRQWDSAEPARMLKLKQQRGCVSLKIINVTGNYYYYYYY